VTKHWTNWTPVVLALAFAATGASACDGHPTAAEAKDTSGAAVAAPVAAVAATGDTKGCDMPCCAHAKETADAKVADAKAVPAVKAEAPCSGQDAKGCPKKATAAGAVAKADPAKDAPRAQPAAESPKDVPATDPGTRR